MSVLGFAFFDELSKLASSSCKTPGKKTRSGGAGRGLSIGKGRGPLNLRVRQGRRPIRVDKLLEKSAVSPQVRRAAPYLGTSLLAIGGYKGLEGEAKKYQLGRRVARAQKAQMRAAKRRR